jgi:CHAD domain-containing protein
MSYHLEREDVQHGVQRIARDQIDHALREIASDEIDRHEVVHQVRKRCKKLRGLVRLVRPALGEETYRRENAWYRDAARTLSALRDAEAMLETFDALLEDFADEVDARSFAPVLDALRARRDALAERDAADLEARLERFAASLREGRERVAAWRLDAKGFDAVAGGLRKTYARGRRAMDEACAAPSAERFHEWRKRAKYGWYHARLLRGIWRRPMRARAKELHRLSDLLGDHHDLAVLRETLAAEPAAFAPTSTVEALLGLADRKRVQLETDARLLGARCHAEKPKHHVRRLGAFFEAWSEGG